MISTSAKQRPRAPARPVGGAAACPGLFNITPARDGGLCRLKLPLGELTAPQLRAVAAGSNRFGNGIVEITNRSNLQIRGVRPEQGDALAGMLLAAGLGIADMAAEPIRNVMVSPTAGIDPGARIDVRPIALNLLARLTATPDCHRLSPKFSILIDGGERVAAAAHPQDIWLAAAPHAGHTVFAFGLAGHPPASASADSILGAVAPQHAADLVSALIALFLRHADEDTPRYRDTIARHGIAPLLSALKDDAVFPLLPPDALEGWHRAPPASLGHIGTHPQAQAGLMHLGAAPPLGRLAPHRIEALADLIDAYPGIKLRLTPWQSVLLVDVPEADAASLRNEMIRLGFACDADDPLASLHACSGSTGCPRTACDTKADGLRLAALLGQHGVHRDVHLTGCERSCASARVADFTLLGLAPDRYDVFRRTDGAGRFGRRIGEGLGIEDAAILLSRQRQ